MKMVLNCAGEKYYCQRLGRLGGLVDFMTTFIRILLVEKLFQKSMVVNGSFKVTVHD